MTTKSRTRQLTFTPEAKELLTPFRKYALEKIYDIGCTELGGALKSAKVLAEYDYEEPCPPTLLLVFNADIDLHERRSAYDAIFKKEYALAETWADSDREEWHETIAFDVFPLKIL